MKRYTQIFHITVETPNTQFGVADSMYENDLRADENHCRDVERESSTSGFIQIESNAKNFVHLIYFLYFSPIKVYSLLPILHPSPKPQIHSGTQNGN